ncbi:MULTISPECIES: hypothetical protein [Nostoc]|uniref:Uncharacterized protein n=1 Tax=Nostoc paludosum FACHB-159 TaxID=2692908 RepID=A0ABR8KAA4_9NOSO|nr:MULTISPECIES: hypothetical protein [Nostoc]MBD2679462.1 hypothetical protein [Nostoc sp. FACHB-857]MBD2735721.1 hypothetical protein [Nostoc paludosum FACHB-159]
MGHGEIRRWGDGEITNAQSPVTSPQYPIPSPQSPMLQQIVDNTLKNHLYLSVHFNL